MKIYEKIINGVKQYKSAAQIVIINNGAQIFNPTEEMIFEDGWKEYTAPIHTLTEEESLKMTKNLKIQKLISYDSSKEVNICYINIGDQKISYWADKQERSVLKTAIQDCLNQGRTKYRLDLRDFNISIDMDCNTLLNILSALEVYAIDCYNKTTDHIYAVNNLTTVEEIEAYDYRVGYPEKLSFNLNKK